MAAEEDGVRPAILTVAAALCLAGTAGASASGRFQSQGSSFEVKDAYSYWGDSSSPLGGTVIRVAISGAEISPEIVDEYHDRDRALKALAGDEVALVFFEFDANGKYHGLSYYVGPGNGCGYCLEPEVRSTVRAEAGRLKGRLAFPGTDPSFDVTLDVPIPAKETGKPLPAGGGAAGKAFLAYHTALAARDHEALPALLDASERAVWAKWEKEKKLDGWLDYRWEKEHLELTDPEVTGGFQRGEDRAVLIVRGKTSGVPLEGEVLMRRENGAWRLHSEIYHPKL